MKSRFPEKNRPNNLTKLILSVMMISASLLATSNLSADARYRVKASDNLDRIVSRHYVNNQLSKSQLMVAVLARNPRAFKGGNINFLMRGRRLVLPSEENIQAVSEDEARAILGQHARYFRRGITGDLSSSDYKLSSTDLDLLNTQHQGQQVKLKKLEAEREQLRNQLEKLKEEKKKSDEQLEELEVKLQKSVESKSEVGVQQGKQESISKETLHENIISEDKKKRILEEQVNERTQKLKESNAFLQKKLQETRSELAENTLENISLGRKLDNLKSANKGAAQLGAEDKEQKIQQDEASSVATEIGEAKHTSESLDTPSDSGMGKLAWLLPVLALFAALWFLLRYFLGGRRTSNSNESETYATPAFESSDTLDEDYEEVSLETSIKLDVARAYIEADDLPAANEMLQEVIDEGSVEQQQEAIELMTKFQ